MPLNEALSPDKSIYLERSFTVRFRCLLDNTSGFLRLDIRGRVKILHGQNRKTEEPPLALFAYCTPFGPPSLMEIPQKENMFKSKHKLDLSLVSMDQRGKMILGYSDAELASMGGYSLVHFDDLAYVASAHQERKWFQFTFFDQTEITYFIRGYSFENGRFRHDRISIPKERRRMAMAANQLTISLQEFQTRFRHQHTSPTNGRRRQGFAGQTYYGFQGLSLNECHQGQNYKIFIRKIG